MKARIATTGLLLAALAACSPTSDAPPPATNAETTASAPPPAAASAKPQGDCDLFSAEELSQAFDGRLRVHRAGGRGGRGSGCTYSLAGLEESQLVLQAGGPEQFDARKQSYSGQSGVAMEPLDLGREAWLVNKAQVIAVREDGGSVSLGLQLITFDQEPPVDESQARAGLEELARLALERL